MAPPMFVPVGDPNAYRGLPLLVVMCVFTPLAAATVALRLYTRMSLTKTAGKDDICIVLGLIFSIGVSVCYGIGLDAGSGRHIWALPKAKIVDSFITLYASALLYNFSIYFIQISILLLYLRICSQDPIPKRMSQAMMVIVSAQLIAVLFTNIFMCAPVSYFWDRGRPGSCINIRIFWLFNSAWYATVDLVMLIIAFVILRHLTIPKARKVSVALLLSFGSIALIASAVRIHAMYAISKSRDPTWNIPPPALWSSLEMNVGIICSSMSTLRPLMSRFVPSLQTIKQSTAGVPSGTTEMSLTPNAATLVSDTRSSGMSSRKQNSLVPIEV